MIRVVAILIMLAGAQLALSPHVDAGNPTECEALPIEEAQLVDDALAGGGDGLSFATVVGRYSECVDGDGDDGDEPTPAIDLVSKADKTPAGIVDRPCASWSVGFVGGVDLGYYDATQEADGASSEEILADIISQRDPVARPAQMKGTVKSAASQSRRALVAQEPFMVDQEAAAALLREINSVENDAPITYVYGDGEPTCDVEYFCGAERVDDVLSGHIDSEDDGVYHGYVTGVALGLDLTTFNVRRVESLAGTDIAAPSSDQGIRSLAMGLAEQGLDESPDDLSLPVFNYCLVGENGLVEVDEAAAPAFLPFFTWTPVENEYDIPGASRWVYEEVVGRIEGELPDMRTIPPIESGVSIVKFPMWLWLDEPFTFTDIEATSERGAVRVRGRATFDSVTWTLGEHEITCDLDEMKAYIPKTGMNPGDVPPCHHVFDELVHYTMSAAVTYRIEQQISVQPRLDLPFPETPWTPQQSVTVTSTSAPLRVEAIYSVNIPIDFTDAEIDALLDDG